MAPFNLYLRQTSSSDGTTADDSITSRLTCQSPTNFKNCSSLCYIIVVPICVLLIVIYIFLYCIAKKRRKARQGMYEDPDRLCSIFNLLLPPVNDSAVPWASSHGNNTTNPGTHPQPPVTQIAEPEMSSHRLTHCREPPTLAVSSQNISSPTPAEPPFVPQSHPQSPSPSPRYRLARAVALNRYPRLLRHQRHDRHDHQHTTTTRASPGLDESGDAPPAYAVAPLQGEQVILADIRPGVPILGSLDAILRHGAITREWLMEGLMAAENAEVRLPEYEEVIQETEEPEETQTTTETQTIKDTRSSGETHDSEKIQTTDPVSDTPSLTDGPSFSWSESIDTEEMTAQRQMHVLPSVNDQ